MAAIANGVWEVADDSDWFAVELVAGQSYTLVIDGAAGGVFRVQGPGDEFYLFDGEAGSNPDQPGHFTALTSGTYWFSATGVQAGSYSIRINEIADDFADNSLSTGVVAAGQVATGRAEASADADWFKTSMVAGREYTFTVKSTGEFEAFVTTADGAIVSPFTLDGNGKGTFVPLTSGEYFIVVREAGDPAGFSAVNYRLTLSSARVEDDYGQTPRTAGTIVLEDGVGAIDARLNYVGDADWFKVDMVEGETYRIRLSGAEAGSNGMLAVLSPRGEFLSFPGAFGAGTPNETSFTATKTGTFYVQAAAIERTTDYHLEVARVTDDFTDSAARAGSVVVGGSTQAMFEAAFDTDWIAVEVVAGTSYSLNARTAGNNSPYFALANFVDASGNLLGPTFTATTSGTVYVEATGYASRQSDAAVRYTVGVASFADDFADNASTTGVLAVGGTASGNIQAMQDSDWFRVDLVAGKSYVFSATGGFLPPTLALHDAEGVVVSAGNVFTAQQSGTYFLAATGFLNGAYTVRAVEYADDYLDYDATSGRFLSAPNYSGNGETVTGDGAANDLSGGLKDDYLQGGAGDDRLAGARGNDLLDGGTGADRMVGGVGDDSYVVDHRDDRLIEKAGQGYDTVNASIDYVLGKEVEALTLTGAGDLKGVGNALHNRIEGNAGDNRLEGGAGDDLLAGGAGNDVLLGGEGKDTLFGGLGADRFQFGPGETGATLATADMIMDFSHAQRDRIVLSGIDAVSTAAGDQAFSYIGAAAFSGVAGQLRLETAGSDTMVYGDVNGDSVADVAIRLAGHHTLVAADFVL